MAVRLTALRANLDAEDEKINFQISVPTQNIAYCSNLTDSVEQSPS
jgi:hypothetical protein